MLRSTFVCRYTLCTMTCKVRGPNVVYYTLVFFYLLSADVTDRQKDGRIDRHKKSVLVLLSPCLKKKLK